MIAFMKKAIFLPLILILLSSCFIAVRVPTSTTIHTLIIENPTDAPMTVTSTSFTRTSKVTIPGRGNKEVEVRGAYGDDLILNTTGKYYSGRKQMAVEVTDGTLRCEPIPDRAWVKIVNYTGYTIEDITVSGSSVSYDKDGNEYRYNRLYDRTEAYFPVYGSDCGRRKDIEYRRNGYTRYYTGVTMPIAGKTLEFPVTK